MKSIELYPKEFYNLICSEIADDDYILVINYFIDQMVVLEEIFTQAFMHADRWKK